MDVGVEAVQKFDGTMDKEVLRKALLAQSEPLFENISTTDLSKKLEALATPPLKPLIQ
jgi:hypothetical protein